MKTQLIKVIFFNTICLFFWVSLVRAENFYNHKASFSVSFKEESSHYNLLGIYVLPHEKLTFTINHQDSDPVQFIAPQGSTKQISQKLWQWISPSNHGLYKLRFKRAKTEEEIVLNAFVMVKSSNIKTNELNGFKIGNYPIVPFKKLPIYTQPTGFIEVTKANQDTFISPHFKLRQFLCKQDGGFPKYLVLRERLLLKLELILEEVNSLGIKANTFHIMSGYRTPYYNKAIGNVANSRHIFGGAADIFIDANPKDGIMDDLNKDGVINHKDAKILSDIIDNMYSKSFYQKFIGGLAPYRKTPAHGPFVHVDARGFKARWGD